MLTIDRQQPAAPLRHGLHEPLTAHDQRFLVGQQKLLASPRRSDTWLQAGRTDDGRHHGVNLRVGTDLAEGTGARQHLNLQTFCFHPVRQQPGMLRAGHHSVFGTVHLALLEHGPDLSRCREGKHPEPFRVAGDDVQGVGTD